MNNLSLGIDVSKESYDVMLLAEGKRKSHCFKNNPKGYQALVEWLEKREATNAVIGLESTGRYGLNLCKHLYAQGLQISMINAARIKYHGKTLGVRNKTDKYDAFVIADFCQKHELRLWEPPKPEIEELQEMTRLLETLKVSNLQAGNRIESGYTSEVVNEQLEEIQQFFRQKIAEMEEKILKHIHAHENLLRKYKRIISVKGIGPSSAPILLAEIQDESRFDNASQLAAYAGVTPQNHQSGKSINKPGRMSKAGNKYLRRALYMPALVASRHNPIIQAQYDRLIEKGKCPKVALGAAMHKLLRIVYGVLKNDCPFDPDYAKSS